MSRARHQKRAAGGKAEVYAGEGSNVLKEAMERKRGGKVEMKGEGEEAKARSDRPKRAKGGRVKGEGIGADRMPLSSAAKIKEITKGEQPEGSNED